MVEMVAEVIAEVREGIGWLTLNRPKALNALSLDMVRALTAQLLDWRDDARVRAVVLAGAGGKALCAGGDIRFFHQAALAGDPRVDDFFTEEYSLNHLIHVYPKPYIALMDGVVMGGGMGISQGGSLRVVTERTRMAMPETNIGLFPDVGGSYFLSRTPGAFGEYLGLTGVAFGAADALALGLADASVRPEELGLEAQDGLCARFVAAVRTVPADGGRGEFLAALHAAITPAEMPPPVISLQRDAVDAHFSLPDVPAILAGLERTAGDPANGAQTWAAETLAMMRARSPLMMAVVLEQIRRGRKLSLADCLRMERNMVRHCFQLRPGAASETVEGIRALVIDKDHAPRWNPTRQDEVTPEMVAAFFVAPWPAHAHPLRFLDQVKG